MRSIELYKTKITHNFLYLIIKGLTFLFFILTPFYIFPSGSPQVGDYLFIVALGLMITRVGMVITADKNILSYLTSLTLFVVYVVLVNLVWSLILNQSLNRNSMFYIFNYLISLFIVLFYSKYRSNIYTIVYYGILYSLLLQTLLALVMEGVRAGRNLVFFNNPNQLGYYALLSICIMIFTYQKQQEIGENNYLFFIGLLCGLFLVLISLSKAAIASTGFILLYYAIIKNKHLYKRRKNLTLIVIFTSVLCLLFITTDILDIITDNNVYIGLERRIFGQALGSEDSIAIRGYSRMLNHYDYLLFGQGEGAYWRFDTPNEFHSTLGNVVFSYGFMGFIFFIGIIYFAFKNKKWNELYLFIGLMLYGLTHNGIRNSLLWIFISLVACDKNISGSNNKYVNNRFKII